MFALDLFIKRTVKLAGLNHIITKMFGDGWGCASEQFEVTELEVD